jgi:hypothetical protein
LCHSEFDISEQYGTVWEILKSTFKHIFTNYKRLFKFAIYSVYMYLFCKRFFFVIRYFKDLLAKAINVYIRLIKKLFRAIFMVPSMASSMTPSMAPSMAPSAKPKNPPGPSLLTRAIALLSPNTNKATINGTINDASKGNPLNQGPMGDPVSAKRVLLGLFG